MKESEDTDGTEKGCILVWRRARKHLREMQPGEDKSGEGALGAKVVVRKCQASEQPWRAVASCATFS